MADEPSARDAKLIQWLNEAYGKEKQLETALQAHIRLTDNAPHKKRLQQHLKETKDHARQVERRIKKLGGKAEALDVPGAAPDAVAEGVTAVANLAGRAVATAQGAVQGMRGTSPQERQLKNAKDELHEEAEEIANYTAIIALAEAVGDNDTVKMAKGILREEQRMYAFIEKQIPKLTKEVVKAEIPASERKKASSSRSRSSSSRSSSSRSSGGSSSRSRSKGSSSSRSSGSSSRSRSGGSSSKSGSSRSSGSTSRSSKSSSGSGSSRSGSSRSSSSRSGGSSSSRSGGSSSRSSKSSSRSGGSRSSGSSRNSGSGSSSRSRGGSSS